MIKEYKTKLVFKISVLLALLALSLGFMFGTTYCRYLTQKDLGVEYKAKTSPSIYMGDTTLKYDSLFEPIQWQTTLNQTSADFSLQNTKADKDAPIEDIKFCLRACVVQQTAGQDSSSAETLPIKVVLKVGDASYEAQTHTLSKDTLLNHNNNMDGEYFIFNSSNIEEVVFSLDGNSKSKIDFNVTVDNLQNEYQKVYLCLKRV